MWHVNTFIDTSAGKIASGHAGSGPPLVLAHGWPWSSYAWSRIIPTLAEHFQVYWYDMPGFGASDMAPARPPHLGTQGEVFAEMLELWNLDAPMVLAHDFGGAVSLRAHLIHGCNFSSLILMNVVAMRPWGSEFFDHVGRHIDAFIGLPRHIHEAVARAYINGALIQNLANGDFETLVHPWLSDEGKHAFYAQFALADEAYTAEIEPDFPKIRAPVTVLWGEDDPWIPLERGQVLADAIGTDLRPLPGLGHLPQLEDPAQTAIAVLAGFAQNAA